MENLVLISRLRTVRSIARVSLSSFLPSFLLHSSPLSLSHLRYRRCTKRYKGDRYDMNWVLLPFSPFKFPLLHKGLIYTHTTLHIFLMHINLSKLKTNIYIYMFNYIYIKFRNIFILYQKFYENVTFLPHLKQSSVR